MSGETHEYHDLVAEEMEADMDSWRYISPEVAEQVGKTLEKLPEKPKGLTKYEVVKRNYDFILEAKVRGYGLQDVADILAEMGVPISVATLASYLQRIKRELESGKRSRGRKTGRKKKGDLSGLEPPSAAAQGEAPGSPESQESEVSA